MAGVESGLQGLGDEPGRGDCWSGELRELHFMYNADERVTTTGVSLH